MTKSNGAKAKYMATLADIARLTHAGADSLRREFDPHTPVLPGRNAYGIEPYLIQEGFIQRMPRGRVATPIAYRHLGLTMSGTGQETLKLPIG